MGRVLLVCLCVLAAGLPPPVAAQSYQQYHDGLVSVQAKKVLGQDQQTAFEVCAHLIRQEEVGPLQVRLNLWGLSGGFLTQVSTVLRPGHSSPACERVPLPPNVKDLGRWEIARFQFLREPTPQRAGRLHSEG